jgi:hypothetical protein
MILGTHEMSTWFGLQNWVWQKWYQSRVNRRNASLDRRVLSLVLFWVFAKYFILISHLCFWFTKSNLMVIYSHFLLFSRWWGSWQWGSTFMRHHNGMLCLRSPIAMISMLAISRGLCGQCSHRWVLVSPHSSLASWGYFMRTHTYDMWVWSSIRGLWLIIFIASARWSRLLHRGGHLRVACEMLCEKLWPFCNMKRMTK